MQRSYAIHPGIGIARVGDSPDDYFVGPEVPGGAPLPVKPESSGASDGSYKDARGHVKRQGARFRIFETTFDDSGQRREVREITAAEAQIEWTVHLVNAKAAAPRFTYNAAEAVTRRNAGIPEHQLVIDAGSVRIAGSGQGFTRLAGAFQGLDVPLGDLLTDRDGRLIVLGGFGSSRSVPARPVRDFVNNDGWCDDVSDGPVRATIRLNGSGNRIEAESAWVIVAPPTSPRRSRAWSRSMTWSTASCRSRWTRRSPSRRKRLSPSPGTSIRSCGGSRRCTGSAMSRPPATVQGIRCTSCRECPSSRTTAPRPPHCVARSSRSCGRRLAREETCPNFRRQ